MPQNLMTHPHAHMLYAKSKYRKKVLKSAENFCWLISLVVKEQQIA